MHYRISSRTSSDKFGDSGSIQKTLNEMHIEAKGKAVMGSSKKVSQVSRTNVKPKEVTEVKKSNSIESSK